MDYNANKLTAGEYIIIECYRKLDPTDMTDIYNDMWLKKYATALVKYQWGENLAKFTGIALPGGVTLNSEQMKQDAQEEILRLEEESRLNFEMPVMDMMG
jgi:RES domain-containing protein